MEERFKTLIINSELSNVITCGLTINEYNHKIYFVNCSKSNSKNKTVFVKSFKFSVGV